VGEHPRNAERAPGAIGGEQHARHFGRPDNEDRAPRVVHEVSRDRPEDQPRDRAEAAVANHDEVAERVRSAVDEDVGGAAVLDRGLDTQPMPAEGIGPLLEDEREGKLIRRLCPRRRRRNGRPVQQRLDDPDQAYASPKRPSSTLDEFTGNVRGRGAIDPDQDSHPSYLRFN
jgi:hypothetical protein